MKLGSHKFHLFLFYAKRQTSGIVAVFSFIFLSLLKVTPSWSGFSRRTRANRRWAQVTCDRCTQINADSWWAPAYFTLRDRPLTQLVVKNKVSELSKFWVLYFMELFDVLGVIILYLYLSTKVQNKSMGLKFGECEGQDNKFQYHHRTVFNFST